MKCKNCGQELPESALFCGHCGKATETEPIDLELEEVFSDSSKEPVKKVTYAKPVSSQGQNFSKSNAKNINKMKIKSVKSAGTDKSANDAADDGSKDEFSEFIESFSPKTPAQETTSPITINSEQIASLDAEFGPDMSEGTDGAAKAGEADSVPEVKPVTKEQERLYRPMKILDWFVVWLLSIIPGVNIVMLFIWSFGKRTNKSKKSYAQFNLIVLLALTALMIIGMIVLQVLGYTPQRIMDFLSLNFI